MRKPEWKLNLPCFSYDIQKDMFVDFLTGHIDATNCVHYWV